MIHLLEHGHILSSPGCHFSYRVIAPCCRLFDREQLPWPSCRLQWRSKEPSWRRIGKRFVVDLATRGHPTYSVEIVEQGRSPRSLSAGRDVSHSRTGAEETQIVSADPLLLTLYWVQLPQPMNDWWFSDRLKCTAPLSADPPIPLSRLVSAATHSGSAEDTNTDG